MFKNICKFEIAVGEKVYHFLCDQDSPIEHVKAALFQISKLVGQIEDQATAAQQKEEEVKEPEEPKEE